MMMSPDEINDKSNINSRMDIVSTSENAQKDEKESGLEPDTQSNSSNYNEKNYKINQQYVYTIDNSVLLIMRPDSACHFIGKLKVWVLYGSAEIYGYTCTMSHDKPLEVYSPKVQSFVPIQSTLSSEKSHYDLSKVNDCLTKGGVDLDIPCSMTEILEQCGQGWTILWLQKLDNTLTQFLDKYCQNKIFPKIERQSRMYYWQEVAKAEKVLQVDLYLNESRGEEIIMSHVWKNKITMNIVKKDLTLETRSRCILFGGKGVGKSTALRYLINQTLPFVQNKKMVLLDLDPGQAECTPGGSVSLVVIKKPLLGPNFSHLMTPYHEIALGQIDVGQCVSFYLSAVAKLVDVLNNDKKLKGLSVIVNTMGFSRGVGEDIACAIIKLIQPTDVIEITDSNSSNNFSSHLNSRYVNKKNLRWTSGQLLNDKMEKDCSYDFELIDDFKTLKIQPIGDQKRVQLPPYKLREIVLLAYLSKIVQHQHNVLRFYDDSLLNVNSVQPYSVSFSSIYVSLTRTAVPPTHVLSVINGNVVGLCGVDVEQVQSDVGTGAEGVKVFIRPPLATCYGHGIVRGVDVENKRIYLNTPLELGILKRVNCLMGCTPTPKTLMELDERVKPYAGGKGTLPTSMVIRRGISLYAKSRNMN